MARRRLIAKGKFYSSQELIQTVHNLYDGGMTMVAIAQACGINHRTVRKILMNPAETQRINQRPDYQALYVLVTERGLPLDLIDEEALDSLRTEMKKPWIHASAVDAASVAKVKKRIQQMGDQYGQIHVARLTFVDPLTFLDFMDDTPKKP